MHINTPKIIIMHIDKIFLSSTPLLTVGYINKQTSNNNNDYPNYSIKSNSWVGYVSCFLLQQQLKLFIIYIVYVKKKNPSLHKYKNNNYYLYTHTIYIHHFIFMIVKCVYITLLCYDDSFLFFLHHSFVFLPLFVVNLGDIFELLQKSKV
eukprot:UN00518